MTELENCTMCSGLGIHLDGMSTALVRCDRCKKIERTAQEILDSLSLDNGHFYSIPGTVRDELECCVANLIAEGLSFEVENIDKITSPEDDEAEVLLQKFKSGKILDDLIGRIFTDY